MRHNNGQWAGYSYEWNEDLSDATLLPAGKAKLLNNNISWTYPGRDQCMQCHSAAAGFALGPEAAQINGMYFYSSSGRNANQLATWDHIGLFTGGLPAISSDFPALVPQIDTTKPLVSRARSYLHSNCSGCHRPGGPAQAAIDLRFNADIDQMNVCNSPPTEGDLGVAGARILVPGDTMKSVISLRMHALNVNRMPPLGTEVIDGVGTALVDEWIGTHDVCDVYPDSDGDGTPDNIDNCIYVANADQWDRDGDGYGDVCDGWNAPRAYKARADSNWTTVDTPLGYPDAVVIAGPPTYHDDHPGVVRVRNISDLDFQIRFQEWSYRKRDFADTHHAVEDIPYLVLQPGRRTMSDASVWEVGTFNLGGTGSWQGIRFSEPFANPPHLFLTAQTSNGVDPVTVRVRNIGGSSFEAALFEEEALMGGHAVETIGYLAIHNPQSWGSLGGTPYLLQQRSVEERFVPVLSASLKLEEEQSLDLETSHGDEGVSVLVLGRHLFAQITSFNGGDTAALRRLAPEYEARMEWGVVDGIDHEWTRVPLAKRYTNPVVVAKAVSSRGSSPGVVRLRDATEDAFSLRYEEWDYLDDWHLAESVFYLVADAGMRGVAGLAVEAGTVDTSALARNGEWAEVAFSDGFAETPVVLSAVQTDNGPDTVTTRLIPTESGIRLAMDEQESHGGWHETETLGWIAVATGSGLTQDGRRVVAFREPQILDGAALTLDLGTFFDRRYPAVIADVNSYYGVDPVSVRYRNATSSAIDLYLQEEQSADSETNHWYEDIGVFVAE